MKNKMNKNNNRTNFSMKKISFAFLLPFFCLILVAEEKEKISPLPVNGILDNEEILKAAGRATQIFQKENFIHFKDKSEVSSDNGKVWKPSQITETILDGVNRKLIVKSIQFPLEEENDVRYSERSSENGIKTTFMGKISPSFPIDFDSVKKIKNSYVYLKKETPEDEDFSPVFFFKPAYIDINNLFSVKNKLNLFKKENGQLILEVKSVVSDSKQSGGERFLFDGHTGFPLEYSLFIEKEGKEIRLIEFTFSEHKNVSGMIFPRLAVGRFFDTNGVYKSSVRTVIEPAEVSVGSFLHGKKANFLVNIPVGTRIYDEIRNITYKKTGINQSLTEESISKELDAMFENVKKSK